MSEKTVILGEPQSRSTIEKEKKEEFANPKVINSMLKTPKACRPKPSYLSEKKITSFSLIDAGSKTNDFKSVKRMNSLNTKAISGLLTKKLTIQSGNDSKLEKLSSISFTETDISNNSNLKPSAELKQGNRTRNKTGPNSTNHKSCDLSSQSNQKNQSFKSMSKQTTKYK